MRVNRFGNTNLVVSEMGFGCSRLGGILARNGSSNEPLEALKRANDKGITFYDTADMYSQGESEALVGKAFKKNRDQIVIASKGGYCLPAQRKLIASLKPIVRPLIKMLGIKREQLPVAVSGALSQDFSPTYLKGAVEASLRRLQTDRIDLYQLHSPSLETLERGEALAALEDLKAQGKIRYFGVACDTVEIALHSLKLPGVSSVMFPFGLLDQEGTAELIGAATSKNVALISRGCFGGGLLKPPFEEERLRESTDKWRSILRFNEISEKNHRPLLELAMQFSLSFSSISTHLIGMRTPAQVLENISRYDASPLSETLKSELLSSKAAGTAIS